MNTNLIIIALIWINLTKKIHSHEETSEEIQEEILSDIKFTDWDLSDYYEDITNTRKKVLLHTEEFTNEVALIAKYSQYVQEQSVLFSKMSENYIPYEYQRNYQLLLKPGDYLLNKTEFNKLITFAKENDDLSRNTKIIHPQNASQRIGKQTFLDLLATSRNFSLLKQSWTSWQDNISNYSQRFGDVLSLVNEAASNNGAYNAKAYWEMLNEYENGYERAEGLWTDIEPLYRKLHKFVLTRINNHYSTNFTDIPVYLTGSNFGEDWSNLADLVVPHQQTYKDAEFAFEALSIIDIYKLAEDCAYKMNFKKLHENFWNKKNFNDELCTPATLIYTTSKYSEVLTCKNLTWSAYLNAHEAVLETGVKSIDYLSQPRRDLRQSFLNEAIVTLGSIIAIQNLPDYGFAEESDYVNHVNASDHGLSATLLTALRILPRLAYYMAVDYWRLQELEYPSDNMTSSWWEIRKTYQGVIGVDEEKADFLGDPYIVSNTPYLAKFLGGISLFEILSYHQLQPFINNDNLAETLGGEIDFKNAIKELPLKSPVDDLSYNYYMSDVSAFALTEFFNRLEYYLEMAPLIPYPTIARERTTTAAPKTTTTKPVTTTTPTTTTIVAEEDLSPVQNDQQITHLQNSKNIPKPTEESATTASGHSAGMYVLITIGACFFIFMAVLVFKKLVTMKRPRTNNRRYEA